MAASAGLRNGTGSSPIPTVIRSDQASAAAAVVEPALEEAVLPQPELVNAGRLRSLDGGPELLGRALGSEHHTGRHVADFARHLPQAIDAVY